MKGKHSAWCNAKQGKGLVKVTTRAQGQKPRYWSLLFCQLAQSTLPTYSNKIEILSFPELCLETNCSGDKCQTSRGTVLRLGVYLLLIPSHKHILSTYCVPRTVDNTGDVQNNTQPRPTGAERPLKADWWAENFKLYGTVSASKCAALQGGPGEIQDVFSSRGPLELDLKVYTGVHQRRINILGSHPTSGTIH